MAILDWLKEAPLSAVYKERLVDSEKQIASLEQKSVSLDAKVVSLDAKVNALEKEKIELQSRLEESEQNRRALEEKIKQKIVEAHNPPLAFDQKTGTWIGEDSLHYCAKCKSDEKLSPLQITDRGWYCNVCKAPFYDPDKRDRSVTARRQILSPRGWA